MSIKLVGDRKTSRLRLNINSLSPTKTYNNRDQHGDKLFDKPFENFEIKNNVAYSCIVVCICMFVN